MDDPNLKYLVNPIFYSKCKKSDIDSSLNDFNIYNNSYKDIIFYKKRIISKTRELINSEIDISNNTSNSVLREIFNLYVKNLIDYFKKEDTSDFYQENYKDLLIENKLNGVCDLSDNFFDVSLLQSLNKKHNTLDTFVKRNRKSKNLDILPQISELDLKTKELRIKGLKKQELKKQELKKQELKKQELKKQELKKQELKKNKN